MRALVVAVLCCVSLTARAQEVPPAFEGLYSELETKLGQIDRAIEQVWNGESLCSHYSADLIICNSQVQKTKLLSPAIYPLSVAMLDAFRAMGLTTVRINIGYPFLVSSFPRSEEYLELYRRVVAAARERGFTVFIKCTSTSIKGDYGTVDPVVWSFMRDLTGDRYKAEKAQMLQTILHELQPDYLTVENEPETMEAATGLTYTPDSLASYLRYFLARLDTAGVSIGAGVGSWEPLAYVDTLVQIEGLDYIDIHIYPVNRRFVDDNVFRIIDAAKAHGKKVAFGECWLHKVSDEELSLGMPPIELFKRDMFSFWYPLDSTFTRVLSKLAQYAEAEIVTLYWAPLLFGYLDYQQGFEDLPPDTIFSLAMKQANRNMVRGVLSPMGEAYAQIVRDACGSSGVETRHGDGHTRPRFFQLEGSYPNPFRESTTIAFSVLGDYRGSAEVRVFDVNGRLVARREISVAGLGRYRTDFNAQGLPCGLYTCCVRFGRDQAWTKLLVVR